MKCDELKVYVPQDGPYGLEPEEGGNLVEEETCYLKSEVDAAIAELKQKLDEKDKEIAELKKKCEAEKSIGATFSKNGAELARWVEELRKEIESLKASHYAEMVDAGMRERRLRRALWLARAERAKEHVWHDVKPDGSPKEDYEGQDWVLVQLREVGGIELIPRVAEYRRHVKRWVFIDEDYDTENSHEFRYLRDKCIVIGWRDIDFAYYGKKFFVQQEINNNVERKCREKAEEYK